MNTQTFYLQALLFAAAKHTEKGQTVPGTSLPYVVHISNVAMEILVASKHSIHFDTPFAVQLALLHDTIEDTDTTYEELAQEFGTEVAEGVLALTKDATLPKAESMADSLRRIKKLRPEVWAVKLADRINNLQPPPHYWTSQKKRAYVQEAQVIADTLKGGNLYLEDRLAAKIANYEQYID